MAAAHCIHHHPHRTSEKVWQSCPAQSYGAHLLARGTSRQRRHRPDRREDGLLADHLQLALAILRALRSHQQRYCGICGGHQGRPRARQEAPGAEPRKGAPRAAAPDHKR